MPQRDLAPLVDRLWLRYRDDLWQHARLDDWSAARLLDRIVSKLKQDDEKK